MPAFDKLPMFEKLVRSLILFIKRFKNMILIFQYGVIAWRNDRWLDSAFVLNISQVFAGEFLGFFIALMAQ